MMERRAGVRIDADRFDYELARRGINSRQFAELSGVNETTLSRARHGYRLRESTLRRIVAAMFLEALLAKRDPSGTGVLPTIWLIALRDLR